MIGRGDCFRRERVVKKSIKIMAIYGGCILLGAVGFICAAKNAFHYGKLQESLWQCIISGLGIGYCQLFEIIAPKRFSLKRVCLYVSAIKVIA